VIGRGIVTEVAHRSLNPLRIAFPLLRRVDFRGKARLASLVRVPTAGTRAIRFPGNVRVEVDLSEPLGRDYYRGVVDVFELRLVRSVLGQWGGDFVDVGAHIGIYSIAALRAGADRVLAFEPLERSQSRLERNLVLNGLQGGVTLFRGAAGAEAGTATLTVGNDPSWSTLGPLEGRYAMHAVAVAVSTVDAEVARLGLRPSMLKIDVEGGELAVADGMAETLSEHRPVVLCEVDRASATALAARMVGYDHFRIARGRLILDARGGPTSGIYNAVFVPPGDARSILALPTSDRAHT